MSEKKEKGWVRRHWFLSIIFGIMGLFIFLFILGLIASGLNQGTDKDNANPQNEPLVNENTNNTPKEDVDNSPLNFLEEDKPDTSSDNSAEYPCIELSGLELLDYSPAFQSWFAKTIPYKSGNKEIIYDFFITIEDEDLIACEEGSKEGQNSNWVYCGDTIRPIFLQYTNDDGTITKKRSVEITFDKNTKQYLSTKCDTYNLY